MQKMINRRKLRSLRKMRFWRRRQTLLERPRLCVFRSASHIQAQLIDDNKNEVIASASSIEKSFKTLKLNGVDMAAKIGATVAERAVKAGVKEVVFDRNGFSYHGRIKSLAEAARSAGLSF